MCLQFYQYLCLSKPEHRIADISDKVAVLSWTNIFTTNSTATKIIAFQNFSYQVKFKLN